MIDKLEMFIALANERHFGRAAETMGVTQPTLSSAIRQLEEQLGVQLVFRASRFEGLTPEGQRVLDWALRIVGDARALREEMRRQGPIDPALAERWLAGMKTTFPDVREGDRLTGIHRPGVAVRFFHNGSARGEWADADKARRFFGIWLSPQTSEPTLREALLGGRA